MPRSGNKVIFLFIALLLAAGIIVFIYSQTDKESDWTEEYTADPSEEVHVHADFAVYINDQMLDFTDDKYQSRLESIKNPDIHLHDNQGIIIHRHADDITMNMFLQSIGFLLSPSCLTTDVSEQFCIDDNNQLAMYVNGALQENPGSYVLADEDQILLYYGPKANPALNDYLGQISDEACIYSGTCPERGTPPPEACGLTCEI